MTLRAGLVAVGVLALNVGSDAGLASAGRTDGAFPLAVLSAAPNPIDVEEQLTVTVTCPGPPEDGANVQVIVRGRPFASLLPTSVAGNGFVVDYVVPVAAGWDMTLFASCIGATANQFTSNAVVVDVVPLQIPTPFAIPVSITLPQVVQQGDVLRVEVACNDAPPNAGRVSTARPVTGWDPGRFVDLRPFIVVAGNGFVIEYPIPADAPVGEWIVHAECDDPVDFVIPGAPPWDTSRTFTVVAATPELPTVLPPTL